jgi:hypothetical protein
MSDLRDRLRRLWTKLRGSAEPEPVAEPPEQDARPARDLASALKAERARSGSDDPGTAREGEDERGMRVARPEPPADAERPRRFVLSVDDVGQYLVVTGARVTIGHLEAARADLPFLADVGDLHAELIRSDSLREGPGWWIGGIGSERVRAAGRVLGADGWRLADGDLVRLGENLGFRLIVPDPASHTVLLDLVGVDCAGAVRVVLFGDGEGGRLRIGSQGQRHIRVPNLEHEISLVRREDRLLVCCEGPIRGGGESADGIYQLPLPPERRIDLQLGHSQGGRPPFGLGIAPAELPEARG